MIAEVQPEEPAPQQLEEAPVGPTEPVQIAQAREPRPALVAAIPGRSGVPSQFCSPPGVSRQTAVRSAVPEPAEAPGARDQGVSVEGTLVIARLLIASIGLDTSVPEGIEDRELRRGAGWTPGTTRPGENGNVGIAAHRDTFFRPLPEIRSGDRVELETLAVTQSYVVRSVYVVKPEDIMALRATKEATLTLVTCFPFDYLGPAPRRYIVQAAADGGPAPSAVDPASSLAAPRYVANRSQ